MGEPIDPERVLRETLRKLRTLLRTITAKREGVHPAVSREASQLASAIASVSAELRQCTKGRLRTLGEFPIGDVVAYLRALPKAQRDQAFQAAFDADESDPLL